MSELLQFNVFKTVLFYTAFILLAPITTFFSVKILFFERLLNTTDITKNVWSAVAAIVVLHIALGMYIYKAYISAENVTEKDMRDKDFKVD